MKTLLSIFISAVLLFALGPAPRTITPGLARPQIISNPPAAPAATEFTLTWGSLANGMNPTVACNEQLSPAGGGCVETLFAKAHTLVRLTYNLSIVPAGCTTNAVIGVRDVASSTTLSSITVNQGAGGFVDSGVLSVATTAGDKIALWVLTGATGCTTLPTIQSSTAVFQ